MFFVIKGISFNVGYSQSLSCENKLKCEKSILTIYKYAKKLLKKTLNQRYYSTRTKK